MSVRRVGVIGLGTMGAGIAEVFARNGFEVTAVEVGEAALERGRANLTRSSDRAVARGRLSEPDRDALLGRVAFHAGLAALSDADLVIEAVPERLEIKAPLFAELDRICPPHAILASNTSSLSVTDIAVTTSRPDRVVGLHFFNPAPVMKLVEIVRTVVTDDDVVRVAQDLCGRLGKTPVTIGDRAGFIANALLFGYLNQAVGMLDSGYATRDEIDAAMTLGAGLPMGPFALLDLIGLDTAVQVLETMYQRGGRSRRHAPAPLLVEMVTAGLLGRKAGQGFHPGGVPAKPAPADSAATDQASGASARARGGVAVLGDDVLADRLAAAGVPVTGSVDGADLVVLGAGTPVPDDVDVPVAVVGSGADLTAEVAAAKSPDRIVGLRLTGGFTEILRTVRTAPEVPAAVRTALGIPAAVIADRAGGIVEALLVPYLNDAVRMVEAGYASVDDVDNAMTLGCGYPAGPIAMIDERGAAEVLAAQQRIFDEVREPALAPAPLLVQMATVGSPFRRGGDHGPHDDHPSR